MIRPVPRIRWTNVGPNCCAAYAGAKWVGNVFRAVRAERVDGKYKVIVNTDWTTSRLYTAGHKHARRCDAKRCVERAFSERWYRGRV